jgi:hypothetical protein
MKNIPVADVSCCAADGSLTGQRVLRTIIKAVEEWVPTVELLEYQQ